MWRLWPPEGSRSTANFGGMASQDLPAEILAFSDNEEAVVVVDVEGIVIFMNSPAEKLLGVDAEDMVGEFVELLVPEKKRWGHQAYRRGYFAEPRKREMDPGLYPEAERPDGTIVPVSGELEPVRVGGTLYVAAHLVEREPGEEEGEEA
jgi:PAS domain S-box-containing protein